MGLYRVSKGLDMKEQKLFLEKSATCLVLLTILITIMGLSVGYFLSWEYSLFFIPPVIAAFGAIWSHGIQLNKIDETSEKEIK